jgi:hypothetical protein
MKLYPNEMHKLHGIISAVINLSAPSSNLFIHAREIEAKLKGVNELHGFGNDAPPAPRPWGFVDEAPSVPAPASVGKPQGTAAQQKHIEGLEQELSRKTKMINALELEAAEWSKRLGASDDTCEKLRIELNRSNDIIKDYAEQCEKLRERAERGEFYASTRKEEIKHRDQTIATLICEKEELSVKWKDAEESLKHTYAIVDAANADNRKHIETTKQLREQINGLEGRVHHEVRERAALSDRHHALRKVKDDISNDRTALLKQISSTDNIISLLKKERDELSEQVTQMCKTCDSIADDRNKAYKERDHFREQFDKLVALTPPKSFVDSTRETINVAHGFGAIEDEWTGDPIACEVDTDGVVTLKLRIIDREVGARTLARIADTMNR